MSRLRRLGVSVFFLSLFVGFLGWSVAADALTEDDLSTLLKLKIKEAEIVSRIKEDGVGFAVDAAALARLKKAGATDALLAAVQKAGEAKGGDKAQAVTYEQVIQLLKLRISQEEIMRRLEQSPTRFVLGADQIAELKSLKASDALIAAMRERPPAKQLKEISDIAIILDCSLSMTEKTDDGKVKMDVAREVVSELVRKIPQGLRVSFLVYGHEPGCKVKVVRPLGELNAAGRDSLVKYINTLKPTGNTPIALALEEAGKELAKSDNYCGVILITDGMETCSGKPAEVAAKLAQNPKFTFGVNVIGFGVNEEEKVAVREIAIKGKGENYDPKNAAELRAALDKVVKEIKVAEAPPPKVLAGYRAIKILAPTKLKLPDLKEMKLYDHGKWANAFRGSPLAVMTKYGEEFRLPSDEKYEIHFSCQGNNQVLNMVAEISIKERKVVEIRPDDYLGIVRVSGTGQPKPSLVYLRHPEQSFGSNVQEVDNYGKDLVVPAGTYDLFVKTGTNNGNLIERKLVVKAGEIVTID